MATRIVRVGAMVNVNDRIGIRELRRFAKAGLGNFVAIKIHWQKKTSVSKETIAEAIRFCKTHGLPFSLTEFFNRYTLKPYDILSSITADDWRDLIRLAGKDLVSCLTLNERGGAAYWPLDYKRSAKGSTLKMPRARDVKEAHDFYLAPIRKGIALEEAHHRPRLESIDSSLLQKYHLEAGMERVALEAFPGNCTLMFPVVRGAMRSRGKEGFGVDVAMIWYGGVEKDEMWFKRWRLALYYSWLCGADTIYSETGDLGIHGVYGRTHDVNSAVCKRYRKVLKDFGRFVSQNPRPEKGPLVRVGVVHGRYDGATGLWNKEVWGQWRGKQWKDGDAEESWALFHSFYRKSDWFDPHRTGDVDFSGNPPLGQADIIPIEAPLKVLKRYSCLVFLGWNTMDRATYEKLIAYVRGGGRLLMTVGHLNKQLDRGKDIEPFNRGRVEELFGVRVRGKLGDLEHKGIKIVADSAVPGYAFPNWTERVDPKWIDTRIPTARVALKGAKVVATVSGIVAEYQLHGGHEPFAPAMTEHRLGRGVSYLVTLWGYPASRGIRLFYEELLKVVCAGEQHPRLNVCASDKVRYAVYEDAAAFLVYLLNTDFDLSHQVKIHATSGEQRVTVGPCRFRTVTITKRAE